MTARNILMSAAASAGPTNYIEDVFSTYLYTGNGSTQTITNGIDLTGKGGLTWVKNRTSAADNALFNLPSGGYATIAYQSSNATTAIITTSPTTSITTTSSGFTLSGSSTVVNASSNNYVSWTFRKQPKFFDVVTYTGNGVADRTIPHSLGSSPGFIVVKRTDSTGDWMVWHKGTGSAGLHGFLNTTAALTSSSVNVTGLPELYVPFTYSNQVFYAPGANVNGATYVAYLFAHNAGGFGLTGTDNVISCGSYTGNGSANGPVVTLGYEPQWLMVKNASNTGNWVMFDTMRGMPVGIGNAYLAAESSGAETIVTADGRINPTATGFNVVTTSTGYNTNGNTYIYIAIRRGPMKVPTSGTSVFAPIVRTGSGSTTVDNVGFPADAIFIRNRFDTGGYSWREYDRLRGGYYLAFNNPDAEAVTGSYASLLWSTNQNSVSIGTGWSETNYSGGFFVDYVFRRAPGFFDAVCYTGTGVVGQTVNHNLGVLPELIITKKRDTTQDWYVSLWPGFTEGRLNTTAAFTSGTTIIELTTTHIRFVGNLVTSGSTYISYLFASCPGVSKVGTYTGTGTTAAGGGLPIPCGFTTGARFVMIKRTNAAGDWYVFDTARGIVAAADPYLKLNTTAAEVTTIDVVDPVSGGFVVNQEANTNLNVTGANYVFLAIA